jgi:crossover junction endodeoxyribonuclease RuvC
MKFDKGILTLDLGTKTGWAVGDEFGIESGSVDFSTKRFEGAGMRYMRFRDWLNEMIGLLTEENLHQVYFEEVRRHIGTDAAHAYGGFMATLTSWCEDYKIPYQGIPVGVIKKHITGKGNASKKMVIEAVQALGHDVVDDNEADAIAMLLYIKEKEK